jgi:hypothetical protein
MRNDHFLQTLVYHIPHSSIHIPDTTGFITERIEDNLLEMTDWATDDMFSTEGVARLVVPHSRLFCDVERFDDEHEPQFRNGRGFYYSNGYDGLPLRTVNEEHKRMVYNDYYKKHHGALYQAVMEKIEEHRRMCLVTLISASVLIPSIHQIIFLNRRYTSGNRAGTVSTSTTRLLGASCQ